MKKICLIVCLPFFALACSNNNTNDATVNQMKAEAASSKTQNPNAKTDPVCGMAEGDIAYTDYSLYQQDTVWFCSPHCKEQFDKDPAKYVKK